MLKQSLQQKLLQKLSPQQIQIIKLLELPSVQLEARIKKELEDNPVLSTKENNEKSDDKTNDESDLQQSDDYKEDEFNLEDYVSDDDIPAYKLSIKNYSKDDKHDEIPVSVGKTFHEMLLAQLDLYQITEERKLLAKYLIGNIDDDGYLRRDLDAIVDDLAFSSNISTSEDELSKVLKIIQDFDPVGVGARNLQECLLLQIDKKDHNKPAISLAHNILKNFFKFFTRKHYDTIIKKINVTESELKVAIDEILKLNPKPGGSQTNSPENIIQHIVPDFILEPIDGELILSLNNKNIPDLHINQSYIDKIKNLTSSHKNKKSKKDALVFVKQKLDTAKWFIDAIKQRQHTLLSTMHSIFEFQKDFFVDGDEKHLKPMILKDIAEKIGLDISTISRVSNSKYIQTPFGIFPLKYFFSEGIIKKSGEEVSTREIKRILIECVDNEDKKHPLTDEKLVQILQNQSYIIARRTVAKYREQLGIPVARLRKQL